MKTYVTFGQIHVHSVNGKTFDKDCVAVIEASTEARGREMAFEFFNNKFFTTYPKDSFDMDNMKYFPRGFIKVN